MTEQYSDARREFLKTVALLAGAAVAVPKTTRAFPVGKPPMQLQEPSGQGYRETEHISKYYQTARK